jgi:Coenzyme PQQ synthesis protein D (PqqD)
MEYLPKTKNKDIVVQELKDEVLVYDKAVNKAFSLNKTSAAVWNLCDGGKSVAEIARELSKGLKSPATEDLVWLTLDQLKKQNLLDNADELDTRFKGFNRREAVRRIGLASIIALPTISFLVAPTSSNASSTALCGDPQRDSCRTNSDCVNSLNGDVCSNNCCVEGTAIPGTLCIPSPTNPCPPSPGCSVFGC